VIAMGEDIKTETEEKEKKEEECIERNPGAPG